MAIRSSTSFTGATASSAAATLPGLRRELWLKIGQSNSVGFDGSGPLDYDLDGPHPRVLEYSRGTDKPGYRAAPEGEFMLHQAHGQDDSNGNGLSLHFGKRRVIRHPEIERLVIVNRGSAGTGFSDNSWNEDDFQYNQAITDTLAALDSDPSLQFAGFLWHQGEADTGTLSQAQYEAALLAMVTAMRAAIPGAASAPFFAGTMVESWIQGDEAERRPIDAAHRNIANVIPNSAVVDLSAIDSPTVHFTTDALRDVGTTYADVIDDPASPSVPAQTHWAHQVTAEGDLWGNDGLVYGSAATDATRGVVIDPGATGCGSSMRLNPAAWTKALWVKPLSTPAGDGHILSGQIDSQGTAGGHYWGWNGFGIGGSSATANEPMSNHLSLNTWTHCALTFDGTTFRLYVDGTEIGSGYTTDANVAADPQIVEVCSFGTADPLEALVDDVTVAPFAVGSDGIAKLAAT